MPRPTRLARLALAATAAAVMVSPAAAQPAATVALTDPTYDLVDALLARAPVPGAIVGQRPYSRREMARLARAFAARPRDARATRLLDALVAALGDTAAAPRPIALRPLDAAWLGTTASGSAPRAIPANGLGEIDARTVPALDGRGGRPVVRGVVASLETSHVLGAGPIAVVAQPRVSWLAPFAGGGRVAIAPQRLVARGVWHDAALQAGIDALTWGQGGARSLLLSDNAPPLRAITLSTDTAVTLPWVLRRLGRVRATALVADLGRSQNFPHAKLAGYKVSLAPSPRFEIGTALLSQYGGHGAPPLGFEQRFVDLFPYFTWIHPGSSRSRDKLASNKLAGVDARLRFPALAGLSLYWDGEIDDFEPSRLPRLLWEDGAHLFGARFDALGRDGALALDVQLRHTGIRLFEHAQFTSGVTYQQAVLGDPLGPHADAAAATLAWRPAPRTALALGTTYERRDASRYRSVVDDPTTNANFRFVLDTPRPIEHRARLELTARRPVARGMDASARVGTDRVTNEGFARGGPVWRGFGEVGVRYRP